jgi:hypothetical protein
LLFSSSFDFNHFYFYFIGLTKIIILKTVELLKLS